MLKILPISLKTAQEFVELNHRHNKKPQGHKFSVGLFDGEVLIGVGVAGRPVARALDDGFTLEITRTCTLGTKNANSMLYGSLYRAAKALGYKRLVTYTQADESGASLKASGFSKTVELPQRNGWDAPSRRRNNGDYLQSPRIRWEVILCPA